MPGSSLPATVVRHLAIIFMVFVPIYRDKRKGIRLLAVVVTARHRTSSSRERKRSKQRVMTSAGMPSLLLPGSVYIYYLVAAFSFTYEARLSLCRYLCEPVLCELSI